MDYDDGGEPYTILLSHIIGYFLLHIRGRWRTTYTLRRHPARTL